MCRVQGVGELGISLVVVILYLWGIVSGVLAIHHTLLYFGEQTVTTNCLVEGTDVETVADPSDGLQYFKTVWTVLYTVGDENLTSTIDSPITFKKDAESEVNTHQIGLSYECYYEHNRKEKVLWSKHNEEESLIWMIVCWLSVFFFYLPVPVILSVTNCIKNGMFVYCCGDEEDHAKKEERKRLERERSMEMKKAESMTEEQKRDLEWERERLERIQQLITSPKKDTSPRPPPVTESPPSSPSKTVELEEVTTIPATPMIATERNLERNESILSVSSREPEEPPVVTNKRASTRIDTVFDYLDMLDSDLDLRKRKHSIETQSLTDSKSFYEEEEEEEHRLQELEEDEQELKDRRVELEQFDKPPTPPATPPPSPPHDSNIEYL